MKYATVDLPHLGRAVEVQQIGPATLRIIKQKAMKGGQVDFQELMVWKLVFGLTAPNLTESDARELTRRWTAGGLQPIVDMIDRLSGTDEHLRDAGLPHVIRKIHEPMVMATAWLNRFPAARNSRQHRREYHGAKPIRRRGSRRVTASASSSSSDDPPSDAEPPERRFCENARCGADISHLHPRAHYCDNRGACKQAAWRARIERKKLLERLDRMEGAPADPRTVCKRECSRHPLIIDGACFHCGKPPAGVRVWLDDDGLPRRALGFVLTPRPPKRRNPRLSDHRRTPSGSIATVANREEVAASE